jgi:hypothetical protein
MRRSESETGRGSAVLEAASVSIDVRAGVASHRRLLARTDRLLTSVSNGGCHPELVRERDDVPAYRVCMSASTAIASSAIPPVAARAAAGAPLVVVASVYLPPEEPVPSTHTPPTDIAVLSVEVVQAESEYAVSETMSIQSHASSRLR